MSSTFQSMLQTLSEFWQKQNCVVHQGYDLEVGAGTFNPATFLHCLGPEPYRAAYIEPSRRPADGRYGDNPVRMQRYFQFQVILKPSPPNVQELCLDSLRAVGIDLSQHDVRFVHDDWEGPTLGAWGLGWEVWLDGMEILQFTYFQSCGGMALKPITAELTYGTERLARYLQKVDSSFDLKWNESVTYGEIYHRNEVEWSRYNFELASTDLWFRHFQDYEQEAKRLVNLNLPLPAHDFVLKASHAFNMLEARRFFSVTERAGYIARIRDLARQVAEEYVASRERQGFPLMRHQPPAPSLTVPPLSPSLLKAHHTEKASFLLEIGSEELPATFVPIGMRSLEKNLKHLLEKEKIRFESIRIFGTPRRLAALVEGLSLGRPTETVEKRGPALSQIYDDKGSLTKAGEGFFRSLGKEPPTRDQLLAGQSKEIELREGYLIAHSQTPAKATAEILVEALPKLILNLDFPKKMRWGAGDISYARPLRWIVALIDDQPVPFAIDHLVANNRSQGHRQLCPGPVIIDHAGHYLQQLRKAQVLADVEERQDRIVQQIKEIEVRTKSCVIAQDRVMPQVLHLTEFPTLTEASFNEEFLQVPQEVLISEMVEHQKYFPVASADGVLQNLFIITADTRPTVEIRQGNQKVLSARLFDGAFLYQQDLNVSLEQFNEKLKQVTYQKELGTVFEKVERLVAHVETLHHYLPLCDLAQAKRAALLCKADLASEMVAEFPELQGTMGRIYALARQEHPAVAAAIEEHWMPRGENAPLPATPIGILLSLAERLDTIIGCFAVGLQPTSSSDPYGLRRQMLAIVRILIQGKHRLPLPEILSACYDHFPQAYQTKKSEVLNDILLFVTNRIKTVFLEYSFRKDEVEASLSHHSVRDIYDTFCRVEALHQFRSEGRFASLYEVFKRAKGQLNGQSIKPFNQTALQAPAEKELSQTLNGVEQHFQILVAQREYRKAYDLMAELQPPLAKLFLEVKILDDDPGLRDNRIALLQRVFIFFEQLLNFDKIQEN